MTKAHRLIPILAALLLAGCRVQLGVDATPSPTWSDGSGSPSPGEDPSGDDDLTILDISPRDGAVFLPPAFEITARFSEPYLGEDGDISGRFGPTCDAGVILRPQISADRSQVVWSMAADPGGSFCFDLTVLSDLFNPAHASAEWSIASCGVSFDAGRSTRFESIAGDTTVVGPLNAAMEGFYFPLLVNFSNVKRDATFPVTANVAMGRMLQVLAPQDGDLAPTGTWANDPVHGASAILTGCTIGLSGSVACSAPELMLPITIEIGQMTTEGQVTKAGSSADLRITNVRITANAGTTGAFTTLSAFTLAGGISETDMLALAEASGDSGLSTAIQRLEKDVDTDGNGSLDGYSIVLSSTPVWISMMGCDPGTY